ncbi:metal-nicotianamine transporter YSL1-like [Vitis riparia]|uniref:metal-nicotianamine transporter YSL1-like n=1 Tax=Vitis riparia TaxID=96939 RepID=UPI00155B30A8|nr:metal-nicotianamine transporter YSL1-like [Vitis riparia]XP_034703590.1 metal-nicotianamine transporter YSL1-like [Vitis riparia]XP_034703595.1 metal-nicotianamine transporter YSL1-like [Vitis riparia]
METEQEEIEKEEMEKQWEKAEEVKRLPPWTKQITVRGVIASIVIGSMYSVIAMKLNLTAGLTPHLNVSAALLGFVFIRTWTKLLQRTGFATTPFTCQENTMIQTCSVACYSIAVGGGFGSYLLGLNRKTYEQAGIDTEGNSPTSIKDPGFGWMTGFLFLVCFVGLFVLIPLRKIMIIDYRLTYPSGTATAVLINGLHSQDDKLAKKQVRGFMKYFSMSLFWGFFQWFYSGKDECGFSQFPSFGLQAWKQTFYFNFSMTYVGAGMICSHLVNLSLLLGAVLSWGLMWPLIGNLKGEWFPKNLPDSSMKSLNGYKVFISVSLILGDGLYNFVKVVFFSITSIYGRLKHQHQRQRQNLKIDVDGQSKAIDDLKQDEVFIRENIPLWIGVTGYIVFAIISVTVLPIMFPQLKWYFVLVAYIMAPSLAFCNAYGTGLTDINMAYNYGKVALFMLAALSGKENGVVAALAGCGIIKSVASVSCNLMQDFKTSYFTMASPRAMFLSQAIGTAIGCITAPLSFFLFYRAFDVGNPKGEYKAPYALIYRNMAILGVEGVAALPQHCLQLCYSFFAFAVVVNMVKDLCPPKIGRWMPLPMCMAVPFLVGAYFAIDMCLGTLVVFLWHKLDTNKAESMVPAVASGLLCGEGLWILPASILALAKISPPICMKFLAS